METQLRKNLKDVMHNILNIYKKLCIINGKIINPKNGLPQDGIFSLICL